jgi:hypothetical protein
MSNGTLDWRRGPTENADQAAREPEEILDSILAGVAESVLDMSEEELLEETVEQGGNPNQEAEEIRSLLLSVAKQLDGKGRATNAQSS